MYSVHHPSQVSLNLLEMVETHPVEYDSLKRRIGDKRNGVTVNFTEFDPDIINDDTASIDNTRNFVSNTVDATLAELRDDGVTRGRTFGRQERGSSSIRTGTVPPSIRRSRFIPRFHLRNPFRSHRHERGNHVLPGPNRTSSAARPSTAVDDSSLTIGRTIRPEVLTSVPDATYDSAIPVISSSSRTPALAHPFLFGRRDVSIRRDTTRTLRSLFGLRRASEEATRTAHNSQVMDGMRAQFERTNDSDAPISDATYSAITPEDLLVVALDAGSEETDHIGIVRTPTPAPSRIGRRVSSSLRRVMIRPRSRIVEESSSSVISSPDLFLALSGQSGTNLHDFALNFPRSPPDRNTSIVNTTCSCSSTGIVSVLEITESTSSRSRDTVSKRRRNFIHSIGRNRDIFQMLGRFESQYGDPLEDSA